MSNLAELTFSSRATKRGQGEQGGLALVILLDTIHEDEYDYVFRFIICLWNVFM